MSIERIKGIGVPDAADQPRRVEFKKTAVPEKAEATDPAHVKAEKGTEMEPAASDASIYLKRLNTELRFEADSRLKEVLVKIVDPETDEVIRQIPSEEMIAIRKRMEELIRLLEKTGGTHGRSS